MNTSQYSASTLRVLPILEAFEKRKLGKLRVLGVKELADELEVPATTVHRYLTSLVEAGWLVKVERRYTLSGPRLRAMRKAVVA
jgi:DNA-binding IclR family transcriptional regulator